MHVRSLKKQVSTVCVSRLTDPPRMTNGFSGGPCLTFRFHAVMDVDLTGSGLPAEQQRPKEPPFLHTASSL